MPAAILWHSELTGRHSRLAKKLGPIDIPTAPSEHSRNMGTFLKISFGIVLMVLGVLTASCSPFVSLWLGGAGFLAQLLVGIAMIAGAITLWIKAR